MQNNLGQFPGRTCASPDSGGHGKTSTVNRQDVAQTSETPHLRDQDELQLTKRGVVWNCWRSTLPSKRRLTFDIEEPHAPLPAVQRAIQNVVLVYTDLDSSMHASLRSWLTCKSSRAPRRQRRGSKCTGFGFAIVSDE
jgi:hypothetical protein